MQKKLTETSSTIGLGLPAGRKLFKVTTGQYSGRLVAIVQSGPNNIKLAYADKPYSSWSEWLSVADDCAETAFDALMDAESNIRVVYPELETFYLVTRKLTFSGGNWTVGAKGVIYNGSACYHPTLAVEPGGKLWAGYSRFLSPNKQVYVKASEDGGVTWGGGVADAGEPISTGALYAYSKVVVGLNHVHVVYTLAGNQISIRSRPLSGGGWSEVYNIANGSGLTADFDAAVGADGLLAVVFSHTRLDYREYDGMNWGAVVTLDSEAGESPQLFFRENIPVVVYLAVWSGIQKIIKYTDRQSGIFAEPKHLDNRARAYDSVVLYEKVSAGYADRTVQAASWNIADVYHPVSGCLVKSAGDIIYLGMADKFRYLEMALSTAGSGGTVQYSYWDGTNWKAFTPTGNNSNLEAPMVSLVLWTDYDDLPQDWQKKNIDGQNRFWVKIEVVSDYSIGPVASQVSAVAAVETIIFRR